MIIRLQNKFLSKSYSRCKLLRQLGAKFLKLSALLKFGLFMFLASLAQATEIYHFANHKQEAQFQHLLKELRCPVCQNQDLADSNADVAQDLRAKVYKMVIMNKTDPEIYAYLTKRFGDYILFKPQFKLLTFFLWGGPVFLLLVGGIVFFKFINRDCNAR